MPQRIVPMETEGSKVSPPATIVVRDSYRDIPLASFVEVHIPGKIPPRPRGGCGLGGACDYTVYAVKIHLLPR